MRHRGVPAAGALAVVTGAGRGIGRATALELAKRGSAVVCLDIDGEAARETAAECRFFGVTAASVAVDVADRAAMVAAAAQVEREHGTATILVNNAGVGMSGRLLDMSADDWTWIRSINLDGVVHGCAAFVPAMRATGRGQVVNMSSGLAYTHTPTEPAYVATKAAVLALSQSMRADLCRDGIGVTAVCPGVIDTGIVHATRFVGADRAGERDKVARLFRRGHRPEKVAQAVVRAAERNRAVVPVGIEARAGWYLHRLTPIALQQRMTVLADRAWARS